MSVLTNLIALVRNPRGERVAAQRAERRAAPRYTTHLEKRLSVQLQFADLKLERPRAPHDLSLSGYTRDVSESGLGVILPGVRIAGRSIIGADRALRLLLGLPGGVVEMSAEAVRHVPLEGDEPGYLVGIQIRDMSREARERYINFLRSLAVPDF